MTDLAYRRFEKAFAGVPAPFAFVDLDAMWWNADDLLRRAHGKPIRVASKSLRCRPLVEAILARDDRFRGVLAFTLPEALWLADHGHADLVVGYPTVDPHALRALASRPDANAAITLMVDCVEHLDLIAACRPASGPAIRVCLDLDAGLRLLDGRVKIGPKRSPLHHAHEAVAVAREIVARDGVELTGVMCYEGQIAGVGDDPSGRPWRAPPIQMMQRLSKTDLLERRARLVSAIREVADVEFVNGGGTGSLEFTAADAAITELAAGSGFYAPHLFDDYRAFELRPAAAFALPIVRKPSPDVATALGGGYLASGPADDSRLPRPWLPAGLSFDSQEGAGEVQTPLVGEPAGRLGVGDRVYFRHAKAGELAERFDSLHLVEEAEVVDELPTYRGEGRTFL